MLRRSWVGRLGGVPGLWIALASGCVAAPFSDERAGLPDGAECEADDECKSRACGDHSRLCMHSQCDCPGDTCTSGGETSPDCSPGWSCVYYETIFGDIGEVFNIDRDHDGGYCRPTCAAGCPEHYVCTDGMFCTPDTNWADPIPTVTWTGGAEGSGVGRHQKPTVPLEIGQSVMLTASATSPIGLPVETFLWKVATGSRGEVLADGNTASFTLEEGASYGRVELTVRDSEYRSASITVTFDGCFGAGRTCGYQGSGCCTSCDKDSNTCL